MDDAPRGTFVEVMSQLRDRMFTGETLIRWSQGHPRVVELPAKPTVVRLDKPVKRPHTHS